MPRVHDFLIDDENEAKIAAHGIRSEQVVQILDDEFLVVPNRKGRRGVYLVIGHDWGGACIAVPIEPTHDPVVWRPITAWPCKPGEAVRLRQSM
jgi:uncharacterized DUF497 family protein